jgi:hypothetical protein
MPLLGVAVALLLPPAVDAGLDPAAGLALLAGWAVVGGLANGPLDIALFTIRQRRTDPAWTGRAFAVSMALNFLGFPIGAAVAGVLAEGSLGLPIAAAVVACLAGSAFAATLVPRSDDSEAASPARGETSTAHGSTP